MNLGTLTYNPPPNPQPVNATPSKPRLQVFMDDEWKDRGQSKNVERLKEKAKDIHNMADHRSEMCYRIVAGNRVLFTSQNNHSWRLRWKTPSPYAEHI